jgi:cytoskeletal protein RodZ
MANFGETLKQARAHKGVTLKEAEQATRINRNHLAALEDENFAALPPLIYQRGIVRNYAMYLDLDPSRLLSSFEEARGGDDTRTIPGVAAMPPVNMPSHWAPNFAIIAFAVVLSAIVFAWGYSAFVQPPTEEPTATEIVATVTPFAQDIALPTELPPTPTPTPSPTPEVAPTPAEERVETGRELPAGEGDNQLAQAQTAPPEPADQPATEQEPVDQAAPAEEEPAAIEPATTDQAPAADGAFVTSIAINAASDIYVTITADGVEVFEGDIAAGGTTDAFTGSEFEVYTTSGANTLFLNSCGTPPFNMGYEPGEAYYILKADESSCAPTS